MKKIIIFLIIMFFLIIIRIYNLNILNNEKYQKLLIEKTTTFIYGNNAPRGRILDRNGKVLVDNIGIKSIYYRKIKNPTIKEELEVAEILADILEIPITSNTMILKNYWLIKNDNGKYLITDEEYELYNKRKLSNEDIKNLKYERITEENLENLTNFEKEIATIYDLMNKGYSYDKKLIKDDIDDITYSKLIDKNIDGIFIEVTWERKYNYGDTLKDIFGSIGSISLENKNEYLNKGYELNDLVGVSYLEYQYEDYLKGEKDLYQINGDNSLTLIKEGKKGNDLVLSIDIDVQLELERLIKDNILKAKKYKYTNYFSETYSIVSDPNTGEIIAMSGQKLIDEDKKVFENVNTKLINTSYTVGSIVKMATMSVGYKYDVIDINTKMKDGCIKLYQVPLKCSYKDLGNINDLTAISKSSNYYQFKIAIGITNNTYKYNMKLNTTINDFNKFRSVYKEYGLGTLTNIDLPNESIGIIGKNMSSDLLLNLSIGQYDTYTPVELIQYVNTIANNGNRKKLNLMKEIITDENIIVNNYETLNKVNLDDKYLNRLKEAMNLATKSGTAKNYIKSIYKPAGKTGTSETFIDTNNDGVMDTKTISLAFVGFAPYDNPRYSIVVLTPNLYEDNDKDYSKVYITRYISQGITNFLFENY